MYMKGRPGGVVGGILRMGIMLLLLLCCLFMPMLCNCFTMRLQAVYRQFTHRAHTDTSCVLRTHYTKKLHAIITGYRITLFMCCGIVLFVLINYATKKLFDKNAKVFHIIIKKIITFYGIANNVFESFFMFLLVFT